MKKHLKTIFEHWLHETGLLWRYLMTWTKKRLQLTFQKNPTVNADLPPPAFFADDDHTKQEQPHGSHDYMFLKSRFRDIGRMNGIIEALGRDFLTALPMGAYISRLGQIVFLYRRMHEDLASVEVSTAIENARQHLKKNKKKWDKWDAANLYEMETMYRHHCRIDPELIERKARLAYEGRFVHRDVMKNNDWDTAKKFLSDMLDLQKRIGEAKVFRENLKGPDAIYEAMMREYMPSLRLDQTRTHFDNLKEKIDILYPQIVDKQSREEPPLPLSGYYAPKLQLRLNKALLQMIGFDFNRGGLYETGHNPVEGGTPDDTRLVIKTSEDGNFLDSMKSALHEGGHGLYIQGLPRAVWRYQPVGQDLGAAIQESQALFIEMILGRRREFFEYLSPRVEGLFQQFGDPALRADNLYKLKTRVKQTCLRRSADEVTYFNHVYMRFGIESDLVAGRISLDDLPEIWNERSLTLTGREPESYADGCLQDVHWFVGKIGYFPAYTLGHMAAAQMFEGMTRDISGISNLIRDGQYQDIREWLMTNIHSQGRIVSAQQLIRDVTGEDLSHKALVRHFEKRYLAG